MSLRDLRREPLLLLIILCTSIFGCGKSDESKAKSTSDPSSTDPSDTTKVEAKVETKAQPTTAPPDLASIDVSFLVNPCVESGIPAEACRCAGEDAKTRIGHVLLSKMSKAPADSDPAIQSYYSVAEMQKIMHWVDAGGVTCGIEEAE